MPYTTVTVSVPEGKEPDLLRYAASLAQPDASQGEELDDDELLVTGNGRRRWGWGRRAVREAYTGGVSDVWRPFLEYLADEPDEWVAWADLCEHINRTPRQASGVIGAAERRCGGRPPYEKKWEGGERYFRMPASVAAVIREVATADG